MIAGFLDDVGDGEPLIPPRIERREGVEVHPLSDVVDVLHLDEDGIAVVAFGDGTGSAGTVGRYDLDRAEPIGPAVDPGFGFGTAWSNGQSAIVMGPAGFLRRIDLATGRQETLTIGVGGDAFIEAVAFPHDRSSDWFYAVVHSVQYEDVNTVTIQRLDLGSGELLAVSEPGYSAVAAAREAVVAARIDGVPVELDLLSLDPVGAAFPGANGLVDSLDIDASGRLLQVTAGESVRFYDIASRTPLGDPITTSDRWFAPAVLSEDGAASAIVATEGIVVWDLDPDRWADAACAVAGRSLTRAEWDQYIGNLAPYEPTC